MAAPPAIDIDGALPCGRLCMCSRRIESECRKGAIGCTTSYQPGHNTSISDLSTQTSTLAKTMLDHIYTAHRLESRWLKA